jgi:hypothetical protein
MKRLLAIAALAACTEAAEPARLDHAQILAVRATPAHVAPSGRAKIDLLAGDATGAIFEAAPDAVVADGLTVEHAADGWYVTAGAAPGIAPLGVTLAIDGETWPATKQLVIGEPADNPQVAAMQVDGAATDALVAPVGSTPTLAAVATGGEPLSYAWYSSVGDLEHYRTAEAVLDAAAPAEGTVVVVVRDSAGGVTWQPLPAKVE